MMAVSPPSEKAQAGESSETPPLLTQPSSWPPGAPTYANVIGDLDHLNRCILKKPDRIWPSLPLASNVSFSSRTPKEKAPPNTHEEQVMLARRLADHAERLLRLEKESKEDYRDSIQAPDYWMTEVLHYRQMLEAKISSVTNELSYWKEEAQHGLRMLQRYGNPPPGLSVPREDIPDVIYWTKEANHYKAILRTRVPKPKFPPHNYESPPCRVYYELPPLPHEHASSGSRSHGMTPSHREQASPKPRSHGMKPKSSTRSGIKRRPHKLQGRDAQGKKSVADTISAFFADRHDGPVSSRLRPRS